MKDIIIYVAVFALLLITYRFSISKAKNFKLNRVLLLMMPLVALLPLLIVLPVSNSSINSQMLPEVIVDSQLNQSSINQSSTISVVSWVYWIGTGLMMLLLSVKFFRTSRLGSNNRAFSFFKRVVIDDSIEKGAHNAIADHEHVHAQQLHSIDIIFAELVSVFTWFNPFNHLWLKSIKLNHEFEADAVASQKHPEYATILVAQALQVDQFTLVHSFNKSNLKQRLIMMKSKKSGNSLRHYLLFTAVAITSVGICAVSPYTNEIKSAVASESLGDEDKNMAEFPGGQKALMDYMISNIKYPAEAKEKDIEGKVFVSFTVDADGKVSNVAIAKGANKLLDDEAMRVVKSMPKWKPAVKDGKAVSSEMTLPVVFKLK